MEPNPPPSLSRRFLVGIFSAHGFLIVFSALWHALVPRPLKPFDAYLAIAKSNFHWGIFGEVFRFRDFEVHIRHRDDVPITLGSKSSWKGEGLPRELYFYRAAFLDRSREKAALDYVVRWCRHNKTDGAIRVVVRSQDLEGAWTSRDESYACAPSRAERVK